MVFSISFLMISDIWCAGLAAIKNQADIFTDPSITAWELFPSGHGQLRAHYIRSSTNKVRIVCPLCIT